MKIGGTIIAAAILAGLAGCASAPSHGAGDVPPRAGAPVKSAGGSEVLRSEAPPYAPPPVSGGNGSEQVADEISTLPRGHYAIMVESQPSGATVVVDGIPVGRAPRRVLVAGTTMGFFQDPMSIKVRFVASDANSVSQTVEESLTPRDRIPATLVFTPAGAQRRMR